jgi:hypothetical protein
MPLLDRSINARTCAHSDYLHIHTHTPAGCIRGSYVGVLWGLLFHRYDVKPLPTEASRARVLAHTFRIRAGASHERRGD